MFLKTFLPLRATLLALGSPSFHTAELWEEITRNTNPFPSSSLQLPGQNTIHSTDGSETQGPHTTAFCLRIRITPIPGQSLPANVPVPHSNSLLHRGLRKVHQGSPLPGSGAGGFHGGPSSLKTDNTLGGHRVQQAEKQSFAWGWEVRTSTGGSRTRRTDLWKQCCWHWHMS